MAVKLHVVGCGRAGRSLARLWSEAGAFSIGQVANRSIDSARSAVEFIGQGRAVERLEAIAAEDWLAEDWLMLAATDGELAGIAARLAARMPAPPALAFHVSGAEAAEVLRPLDCPVASVHPVCPFSEPSRALELFAGSYALGEGDARALDLVLPAFAAIGAETMRFSPVDKRRYHAATIAASNFLNVIDDLALGLAGSAGLEPDKALKVIVALQRAGLANIERAGPMQALTGPIERGDREVCERLARTPGVSGNELFMALARATVELADRKHGGPTDYLENPLQELFCDPGTVRTGGRNGGV